MEKWLCRGTLGTAGLLLLLFLLDLVFGILLGGSFGDRILIDLVAILSCGVVGYLAWDTARELR